MAFGDRKDGKLIRNLDSLHFITGVLYPNRCDNEAYISETIDLTNLNKYLKKKNKNAEYKYNVFQCIVVALTRTITLRPKLNRFIVNGNFYQRNVISASFVVKKEFSDNGGEALASLKFDEHDTIDTVHEKLYKEITKQRSDKTDDTTESMDIVSKLPRFVSKFVVHATMLLDKYGLVPNSFVNNDPYYHSVVLSNVGSIKMQAGYHHLTNWGTCSMMCMVGEIKKAPIYSETGKVKMVDTIDLGITLDERIADGYYYSKSIRMLKYFLENPETLDEEYGICPEEFVSKRRKAQQ